jgi:hypothetical protein
MRKSLWRWTVWSLVATLTSVGISSAIAADWPGAERRITRLEHTEDGIRAAHEDVEDFHAIVVPEDSKVEVHVPSEPTLEETTDGELMLKCRRCGVFAMGSELSAADAKQLPFLSGGIIRNHIKDHFLSIQARIATNTAGIPYVLDRPLVGVCKYDDRDATASSTEIVDRSARDIRSHGFLVERTADGKLAPPRTLVISIRTTRATAQADGTDKLLPHYEYVFVHARKNEKGDVVTLHGFGTTHYRTRLHCFTRQAVPTQLSDCAIQGQIVFTSFSYGGQFPKANATRKVRLNEQTACNISRITEWLQEKKITGDAWDNLPLIFDAMLAQETPRDEPPVVDVTPISVTQLPK